jgi:pyruvate,water dikinase
MGILAPSSRRSAEVDGCVDLGDERARDARLVGAKAANLARAAAAGLPVLPGFAITTSLGDGWRRGERTAEVVRPAWTALSHTGARPLVVRSSSTVEDIGTSSMAGQFRSVVGVTGWDAFVAAVALVLASADRRQGDPPQPMGVLVQPLLDAAVGGVLFGIDPITADPRRIVVEAVTGSPERLVSGTVVAERTVLRPSGHVVERDAGIGTPLLDRAQRHALARLAADAEHAFGRPQDVEWAFDDAGQLWLLQSRPVTAVGPRVAGPELGPGPVAETFPEPLHPLEQDLWLGPLRDGIVAALRGTGVVGRRRLARSPVVTAVGGRAAADLAVLGYLPERRRGLRWLDPRPGARRLAASWRIGRLHARLGDHVEELIDAVDARLASLSRPRDLDDAALVSLLQGAARHLVAVHGAEVLAGAGERSGAAGGGLAGEALRVLSAGRAAGLDDVAVVARAPVVLALVPPAVGIRSSLPATPQGLPAPASGPVPGVLDLGLRDALRLRARWLQEVQARAAGELGERLAAAGRLPEARSVRDLTLAELAAVVAGGEVPPDLDARSRQAPGPPLPATFRLGPGGAVVPAARRGARPAGGRGAGGGRGMGPAWHGSSARPPRPGDVLVVCTLDPALAAALPGLAGLVAETGSTLSHLAILAREFGVPTAVAVHDALRRFPEGTRLVVDGTTGEVTDLGPPEEETP